MARCWVYRPCPPANFYVLPRRGSLYLVNRGAISYCGYEDRLYPLQAGVFCVGSEDSADRIEFADVVDGTALCARLCSSWHY